MALSLHEAADLFLNKDNAQILPLEFVLHLVLLSSLIGVPHRRSSVLDFPGGECAIDYSCSKLTSFGRCFSVSLSQFIQTTGFCSL